MPSHDTHTPHRSNDRSQNDTYFRVFSATTHLTAKLTERATTNSLIANQYHTEHAATDFCSRSFKLGSKEAIHTKREKQKAP